MMQWIGPIKDQNNYLCTDRGQSGLDNPSTEVLMPLIVSSWQWTLTSIVGLLLFGKSSVVKGPREGLEMGTKVAGTTQLQMCPTVMPFPMSQVPQAHGICLFQPCIGFSIGKRIRCFLHNRRHIKTSDPLSGSPTKWFCSPHSCCQAKGFPFWVRFLGWLMFHQSIKTAVWVLLCLTG